MTGPLPGNLLRPCKSHCSDDSGETEAQSVPQKKQGPEPALGCGMQTLAEGGNERGKQGRQGRVPKFNPLPTLLGLSTELSVYMARPSFAGRGPQVLSTIWEVSFPHSQKALKQRHPRSEINGLRRCGETLPGPGVFWRGPEC